jgi:hypothetical protein
MSMNMELISTKQLISQSPDNLVSDMNGEKVLMSINSGKYYNLGRVGGRIWEAVQSPTSIEQVIAILLSEYDIDQASCEAQVKSFVQLLYSESLVQINEDINS